jgi:micrococcal nuclease
MSSEEKPLLKRQNCHITIDRKPIVFIPDITEATCIDVYDGDTITIEATPSQFKQTDTKYKWKVRLLGIDTPEIRQKQDGAIEARDALRRLILNKKIYLDIKKYGKFGRLIALIYYNNIEINQYMIDNGFAKPYLI